MIPKKNKEINVISKKTVEKDDIRDRHIIDSAQIIDFVDLNYNTTCDLGTVEECWMNRCHHYEKNKNSTKVNLYEKVIINAFF